MRDFGGPIQGTAGDDNLTGSIGNDEFDVGQGGNDRMKGLQGDDTFLFGDAYTKDDTVIGGSGVDAIVLTGHVAGNVVFGSNIASIEQISITSDVDYDMVMKDAAVAAGKLMNFDGGTLDVGNHFSLDASEETDGAYFVTGSGGDDDIRTGAGNDEIFGGNGIDTIRSGFGRDFIDTGDGADVVIFNGDGAFTAKDHVDGNILGDTVRISGDYSAGVTFKADTFLNLQFLELVGGNDYTFNAGNMHPYDSFFFFVFGQDLGAGDTLHFNGSSIDDGAFSLFGGAGEDVLICGAASDGLVGGGGVDTLTGRGGRDTYFYNAVSDSAGKNFDTVNGFDAEEDFFFASFDGGVTEAVLGVDPRVNGGTLSNASFNAELADAIGADEMSESFAVLFKPDAGGFAGQLFLIIDGNDTSGYQVNADIVIRLSGARNMGGFDNDNFGTPG